MNKLNSSSVIYLTPPYLECSTKNIDKFSSRKLTFVEQDIFKSYVNAMSLSYVNGIVMSQYKERFRTLYDLLFS